MQKLTIKSLRLVSISACALLCLLANNAMATNTYFSPSGGVANNGMYTWDQSTTIDWATSAGATPTETWAQAAVNSAFPRFTLGGADTITLTVNGSNLTPMAGLYQEETGTLNIAATPGSSLPIAANIQGFLLTGPVVITCPLTGAGGIEPEYEASGAALSLFATNTYTGGTYLYSSSALVYFNNGSAFGTGNIMLGSGSLTGFNPFIATGGAPITLPNNWVHYSTDTADGINFAQAANTPLTCSGTWTLSSYPVAIRQNGDSTSPSDALRCYQWNRRCDGEPKRQ